MRMQKTVAVAGTHGKTTTTSMIAALLDKGGLDPTVINGGIINRYGSNARLGKGDWWVIEADESDGSFLRLDGTIAVVTNIDPEHLEHYGSFDAVKDAFVEFVENVPFYGLVAVCVDHPEVQNLIGRIRDRRIVTYGFSALADVRAENVTPVPGGTRFDALILDRDGERRTVAVHVPIPGRHNVQNALAAIAVGSSWILRRRYCCRVRSGSRSQTPLHQGGRGRGCDRDRRLRAPPDRNPSGSRCCAEGAEGRVIAVVQPHRYTRLLSPMEEFQSALMTPTSFSWRRSMLPVRSRSKASIRTRSPKGFCAHGHRMVRAVDDLDDLCGALRDLAAEGDMIICMGAGDITKWGRCARKGRLRREGEEVSAVATMPRVRGEIDSMTWRSLRSSGSRAAATPNGCSSPRTRTTWSNF